MICPKCKTKMEHKGSFPGFEGVYAGNDGAELLTLYQCPKCKNIELEKD